MIRPNVARFLPPLPDFREKAGYIQMLLSLRTKIFSSRWKYILC